MVEGEGEGRKCKNLNKICRIKTKNKFQYCGTSETFFEALKENKRKRRKFLNSPLFSLNELSAAMIQFEKNSTIFPRRDKAASV